MPNLSPLASPSATRAVLQSHGLVTKKVLGQNFLVNDAIVCKIIDMAEVGPEDVVLEVGPGIGTLTIALLKYAAQVISIERDTNLPAVLAETCAPWADHFSLITKDALEITDRDLGTQLPSKFVANLPYAVAATLVLDYFERFSSLESATVMVQKEVADRMCASPGTKNYGAFSVKLSLYAQPSGRFAVSPNNFLPPPRVDSAVLRLNRHTLLDESGSPVTSSVLRAAAVMAEAAFANRRKTLINSCKTYFAAFGEEGIAAIQALPHLFEQAAINPSLRGETLSTADYIRLGKALETNCPNILC